MMQSFVAVFCGYLILGEGKGGEGRGKVDGMSYKLIINNK